jgi:hypothetical protein
VVIFVATATRGHPFRPARKLGSSTIRLAFAGFILYTALV